MTLDEAIKHADKQAMMAKSSTRGTKHKYRECAKKYYKLANVLKKKENNE